MRKIDVNVIKNTVKKLFIEANTEIADDIMEKFNEAIANETSLVALDMLEIMKENFIIAKTEKTAMCQDTGISEVFMDVGQEVYFIGGDINDAIEQGIREAYSEGYFRKSIVKCPLRRCNTGDNTPGIVHIRYIKGDKVKITVMPKGFGSENCSKIAMLKPAEGENGVIDFVVDAVKDAASKPCPPIIVGVGIGGSLEKAVMLSKEALLRDLRIENEDEYINSLEEKILKEINCLDIGAQGVGGVITALKVNIMTYPTHIAGLPVAVNISCHALRRKEDVI